MPSLSEGPRRRVIRIGYSSRVNNGAFKEKETDDVVMNVAVSEVVVRRAKRIASQEFKGYFLYRTCLGKFYHVDDVLITSCYGVKTTDINAEMELSGTDIEKVKGIARRLGLGASDLSSLLEKAQEV
jgi:hypothetical protein